MRPEEGDPAYLWDMRKAARETIQFIAEVDLRGFLADRRLLLVVERELEIIGEAARRVSDAFKEEHPEIPWSGIIGQRNIIAHDYGDIDSVLIWGVATGRLPALVARLDRLLPPGRGTRRSEGL